MPSSQIKKGSLQNKATIKWGSTEMGILVKVLHCSSIHGLLKGGVHVFTLLLRAPATFWAVSRGVERQCYGVLW